jgi:DNA-binding HxlR family transcriptional regulator
MYTVKESSTNQENKKIIQNKCPVTYTLQKIGGRWKPLILFQLRFGVRRYGQLKKEMPGISEKMLVQQLRELEADGLIMREAKPVVPPHVEYSLTELGSTLSPVLDAMSAWGNNNSG